MTAVSAVILACLGLCIFWVVSDILAGDHPGVVKPSDASQVPVAGGDPLPANDAKPPPGGVPKPNSPTGPCPVLDGGLVDTPTQEPSELEWESYRGLAMPESRFSGPVGGSGSVSRCFAHTPTGALLAAMQISSRAVLAPDWRSVAQYQILPGPAADEFISRMTSLVGTAEPGLVRDVTGLMQPAGFKFLGYSPDQAVIALAFSSESGVRMQSAVYTVIWNGDDWLLQAQPGGSVSALSQRPESLDGFVPWGKE
ncbi:hypothetical protein LO772_01420 [Yinghuangia sp. ASG 101]|uniref:hypothetical protein n=1 Tax=Yinghuangia sp. ASG 101 TaxID=2896848 RepID=UPI001E384D12|nr:hypothetical protein [Yinghuangia sp. ASG 101]UGQ12299.1 hypothetical protein LO772_01420 [Yinghuangia sp. ASG 101]